MSKIIPVDKTGWTLHIWILINWFLSEVEPKFQSCPTKSSVLNLNKIGIRFTILFPTGLELVYTLIGLRIKPGDIGTIKRSEHKLSLCKSLFQERKHTSMIRKSRKEITVTIQKRFTHHVLKTMLCAWKSACRYETLYREKRIAIVKLKLMKWIRNRRIKQSDVIVREQTELQGPSIISSDPNESIVPQSVQDCQFDLSSSDTCPANISTQTRSNKIQSRTKKHSSFILRILSLLGNL